MQDQIIDIIVNQLLLDKDLVTPDSVIMDDLGADSLDVVEIIMAIETELGVSIPDNDLLEIHTVGELATYVEEHS